MYKMLAQTINNSCFFTVVSGTSCRFCTKRSYSFGFSFLPLFIILSRFFRAVLIHSPYQCHRCPLTFSSYTQRITLSISSGKGRLKPSLPPVAPWINETRPNGAKVEIGQCIVLPFNTRSRLFFLDHILQVLLCIRCYFITLEINLMYSSTIILIT